MNDNDRIILTKLVGATSWDYVGNPSWNPISQALSAVLANEFNEYAEYQNCGVVNRMIRARDAEKYDVQEAPRLSISDAEAYASLAPC